jgi:signal transduction histidine kinase
MGNERLSQLIEPPQFQDDESDAVARSLAIITTTTALLGVTLFAAAPWLTPSPLPSMVVYAIVTTFSLTGLLVLRRGHLRAATTLFSITAWLITTAALVMFGGVDGPVTTSYVAVVVIISSVSGWRAGMVATAACAISSGVMAYLDHLGRFPEPVSPLSPLTSWAAVVSTMSLAAVTLYLTSRTIVAALQRARDKERLLAEHRDKLEDVVAERTRELKAAKVAAEEAAEEVRVREAKELQRVNEEVERLFHAVSHDFRAPLRGVANLAEWAGEDLAEGDAEAVQEHLAKLTQRVARLETMMSDLLSFARVGRTAHPVEKVVVSQLLGEIRDGMLTLPEGFSVTWSKMPVLDTEETLLSQVFLNLIGNALKHHDKPEGRIEIRHRVSEDGEHEFAVADDGPGIPERHREKVFDLFSTLKPRDEVEGSGMGLAFVHKVVTSRGGRLSIEDSPSGGACFVFTWPPSRESAISISPPIGAA